MYTKAFITLAFSAGLAFASPIEKRATGVTSKEFSQGGCKDVLFAFARGSTEPGNMGLVCGPQTSDGIKAKFGNSAVATEGIDYAADLLPNTLPGGTDSKSIKLMTDTVTAMASQCPDSTIVVGGYSQGAAVVHGTVSGLPAATQSRIAGVIMYGDTQNKQEGGKIQGFPPAKTKIICAPGDAVCVGTLTILPPHLSYGANADEGAAFLNKMIAQAKAAKAKKLKRGAGEKALRIVKKMVEIVA